MYSLILGGLILVVGLIVGISMLGKKRAAGGVILLGSIALAALFIVPSCMCTIPTGHTGVVTTFGSVENYTLDAGVHPKLPWQNVIKMDNRVQKNTSDLSCFSSDIQEVNMTYTVNYQISKQDAMTIYKTIGESYFDTVIAPCVTECVKIVTARYSAEAIISKRSDMAAEIEDVLSKRLINFNIILVGTSIENMDFTNAFTDAVEAKQVAEQNKLRAQTEADQRVIEAQAAAEIKKVEAEAAAYEITAKAEAEAQAHLKIAEAEAEANKKINESLTNQLVSYTYAKSWDGKLPTFMSDGTSIPVFDFGQTATAE